MNLYSTRPRPFVRKRPLEIMVLCISDLPPNAISEIGENELDQMLTQLNSYYSGELVDITTAVGPNSIGSIHGETRSLELEGPIDVTTAEGEYRLVMKYVPFDDYDTDNEGIWAIYIVNKEDIDITQYPEYTIPYPQCIDKNNPAGVYIGP